MTAVKYGAFTDANFDVSTLDSGAFKHEPILNVTVQIHQPQGQLTARTFALRWQHVFIAHPFESAFKRLRDPENLDVVAELLLNLITLHWVRQFVLQHFEMLKGCVVLR